MSLSKSDIKGIFIVKESPDRQWCICSFYCLRFWWRFAPSQDFWLSLYLRRTGYEKKITLRLTPIWDRICFYVLFAIVPKKIQTGNFIRYLPNRINWLLGIMVSSMTSGSSDQLGSVKYSWRFMTGMTFIVVSTRRIKVRKQHDGTTIFLVLAGEEVFQRSFKPNKTMIINRAIY